MRSWERGLCEEEIMGRTSPEEDGRDKVADHVSQEGASNSSRWRHDVADVTLGAKFCATSNGGEGWGGRAVFPLATLSWCADVPAHVLAEGHHRRTNIVPPIPTQSKSRGDAPDVSKGLSTPAQSRSNSNHPPSSPHAGAIETEFGLAIAIETELAIATLISPNSHSQ